MILNDTTYEGRAYYGQVIPTTLEALFQLNPTTTFNIVLIFRC